MRLALTTDAALAQTLERSYLLKVNGKIAERPQHMLMRDEPYAQRHGVQEDKFLQQQIQKEVVGDIFRHLFLTSTSRRP